MNQQEELLERLSRIDVEKAVAEYLQNKLGKQMRYNIEAFSAENIYDSSKFWNTGIVKKPTLLDLEKYYKLALERDIREESGKCWKEFREERNRLLLETDWTQLSDAPVSSEEKRIYRNYRKYLRNKPNDYKDSNIKDWKIVSYKEYKQMKYPK